MCLFTDQLRADCSAANTPVPEVARTNPVLFASSRGNSNRLDSRGPRLMLPLLVKSCPYQPAIIGICNSYVTHMKGVNMVIMMVRGGLQFTLLYAPIVRTVRQGCIMQAGSPGYRPRAHPCSMHPRKSEGTGKQDARTMIPARAIPWSACMRLFLNGRMRPSDICTPVAAEAAEEPPAAAAAAAADAGAGAGTSSGTSSGMNSGKTGTGMMMTGLGLGLGLTGIRMTSGGGAATCARNL